VHTLNEGFVEYKEMGMDELIKELDIPGLVSMFGQRESTNKNRGNFQRNFGVSCGQNVGPSETDEDTVKFSGCTYPRLNKDLKHPSVTKAFDIGWKVGQKLGIDYCQDSFLKEKHGRNPVLILLSIPWENTALLPCLFVFLTRMRTTGSPITPTMRMTPDCQLFSTLPCSCILMDCG
jgi:hypothetical protein